MVFPTRPTLLLGENAALSRKARRTRPEPQPLLTLSAPARADLRRSPDRRQRAPIRDLLALAGFGLGEVTIQSGGELDESKSKKMKGNESNLLLFVFNNFSESGLFNELQPIQIKKIALF
jgi:hypothetical protein